MKLLREIFVAGLLLQIPYCNNLLLENCIYCNERIIYGEITEMVPIPKIITKMVPILKIFTKLVPMTISLNIMWNVYDFPKTFSLNEKHTCFVEHILRASVLVKVEILVPTKRVFVFVFVFVHRKGWPKYQLW